MASSPLPVYLPEIDQLAFKAATYVSVAQLTAYLYEWLLSISEEHSVVSIAGFTWSIAIYLLSRAPQHHHCGSTAADHNRLKYTFPLSMYGFHLTYPAVAPVGHCMPLASLLDACAIMRATSTSFLFVLRVRAVYLRSTYITTLFIVLWLIAGILNTLNDASIRVGPPSANGYCISYKMYYPTYPTISSFVFDTLVFIAVSYRLAADAATEQSWRARLQSVTTGKGLFRISRALMISGQLYYLAIILFFWVHFAVMVSPLVPVNFHYLLNTTYMAFTNLMACRVFRGVALGMLETSSGTVTDLSSTRIAAAFNAVPSSRGDPSKALYLRDFNNQYPPSSASQH
ncbi:hypothetical protein FIBSPDRAFT_901729 [Athelia psychrophila]|uniref:G-protein coupled receptors family 1 profile domain-containing protein n=1 Tax=Athelia psychrophila TaxID=1759441 RepID=A0A165WRZ2_9AGAM|nr:hypothetical protein FIBSPDRAFT_901729 [Fibularhizoctonia sp. CBS 109695]